MISRFRWYRVKFPNGYHFFSDSIRDANISVDRENGFHIVNESNEEIDFKFYWRSKLVATNIDVDGNAAYHEISTLSDQDVTLTNFESGCLLRLNNPNRNFRELFNAMEKIVGMGFSIKPLSVSSSEVDSILSRMDVSKLNRIRLSGSLKENEIVARIELAAKEGIELSKVKLLDDVKYNSESASYELMFKGVKGSLSYSSTGLVKISGELSSYILHLLEDTIKIRFFS
ncbi:hypothetical protein [Marinobacterium aestuarii]|uniref:hypothetical protein n=1 Tax=Marinobacterium aestuarii TaxID=1821621 RepID=UPI000A5FD7D2|nr:hypothetical protein [Marinobacterium aestuarii]